MLENTKFDKWGNKSADRNKNESKMYVKYD